MTAAFRIERPGVRSGRNSLQGLRHHAAPAARAPQPAFGLDRVLWQLSGGGADHVEVALAVPLRV
jgi:hypothetical protein